MRFSIRDVLWLMVVVGLLLALWIERSRNGSARRKLESVVEALENVDVQVEVTADHVHVTGPNFATYNNLGKPDPKRPPVVLDGKRVAPLIGPD
jgi:hypothetical protein